MKNNFIELCNSWIVINWIARVSRGHSMESKHNLGISVCMVLVSGETAWHGFLTGYKCKDKFVFIRHSTSKQRRKSNWLSLGLFSHAFFQIASTKTAQTFPFACEQALSSGLRRRKRAGRAWEALIMDIMKACSRWNLNGEELFGENSEHWHQWTWSLFLTYCTRLYTIDQSEDKILWCIWILFFSKFSDLLCQNIPFIMRSRVNICVAQGRIKSPLWAKALFKAGQER